MLLAGCVMRTEGGETYLGPVLLRATDACQGQATAVQSVQVGVGGEIGRQVGLAFGVSQRVAASPRTDDTLPCDRWQIVGAIPGPIDAERWTLSPLYARRETRRSTEFVWRRLFGAQGAFGPELTAFSLGIVSRTELRPVGDAFYAITFDTTRPLASRFEKWPYRAGEPFPLAPTREKEQPE